MSYLTYNGQYLIESGLYFTIPDNFFILELTITSPNTTITIPHVHDDGAGYNYVYNYSVDYGDNSIIKTVSSYNDANCTHIYVNIGVYQLKILGTCETFYVDGATIDSKITKILSWGNLGLKRIYFGGCINLSSIAGDTFGSLSNLYDIYYSFYGCISLNSISPDLFKYATSITVANGTFINCPSLSSIPVDLFRYNANINNFFGTFGECVSLTSIPEDLFKYNINVTTFYGMFAGCTSLTSIPEDLFKYNTAVTLFSDIFPGTSIQSIPVGLFKYNTNVITMPDNFTDILITTIPEDLFKYNTKLTYAANFTNCASLSSIPTDLFRYNTALAGFTGSFAGCTSLTSIPEDLFKYNTAVISFIESFKDCTSLQSIPTGLFSNNPSINDYSGTFNNCINLIGNAPTLWLLDPLPIGINCFLNDVSLANYVDIPNEWKGITDSSIHATVGDGGDFNTFEAAFNYINNSGFEYGNIFLEIISDISESSTALLYESGHDGLSFYSSITSYPTIDGLSITGEIVGDLIQFNNCSNVHIDGRVNQSGETSLYIENTDINEGSATLHYIGTFNTDVLNCTVVGDIIIE